MKLIKESWEDEIITESFDLSVRKEFEEAVKEFAEENRASDGTFTLDDYFVEYNMYHIWVSEEDDIDNVIDDWDFELEPAEDSMKTFTVKVIGDWKPSRKMVSKVINALSDDGTYMTFEAKDEEEAKEIIDEINDANIGGIKSITLVEKAMNEDFENSPYYNFTYKVNDDIFSSLLVKADSEEKAYGIFAKKKPNYVEKIVGSRHISTGEAESLIRRGMSVLEESLVENFKSKEDALTYLKKKAEKDPEAAALIQAFLQLMKEPKEEPLKEDTQIDKVEIEIKAPEEEKSVEGAKDFTPEELAKEAKEIAKTPNPPEAGIDTVIANELNKLMIGELNTINDYNNFIELLVSNKASTEIINIIKDISQEEHTHLGQLQQALKQVSPNAVEISIGELEGAKQIAVPVNVGDPSVDGDKPTEKELADDTLLSPEEAKEKEDD